MVEFTAVYKKKLSKLLHKKWNSSNKSTFQKPNLEASNYNHVTYVNKLYI